MAFSTWSKNARVTMESGRGLGKMALRSETIMEWPWSSEKPLLALSHWGVQGVRSYTESNSLSMNTLLCKFAFHLPYSSSQCLFSLYLPVHIDWVLQLLQFIVLERPSSSLALLHCDLTLFMGLVASTEGGCKSREECHLTCKTERSFCVVFKKEGSVNLIRDKWGISALQRV